MYKIIDEVSIRSAIDSYMNFYAEERTQERFHCKTPSSKTGSIINGESNPIPN